MTPMRKVWKTAFFLGIAVILPAIAMAQRNEPKVRLSMGGATTAGSVDGEAAANLSVGYRFARQFSFEVEVTAIDGGTQAFPFSETSRVNGQNLDARLRDAFTNPRGGINLSLLGFTNLPDVSVNSEADTVLTTVGFRYYIPTSDARFRPYVIGGLGIGRSEEQFDVRILATDTRSRPTVSSTSVFSGADSHTGMAGSAGVGASIRVWKGLGFGVDARYFRLDRNRNVGTFGGTVTYGF